RPAAHRQARQTHVPKLMTLNFPNHVPTQSPPVHFPQPKSRYPQKMVRFTVLSSGSKGNATVVTGGSTRILVDAGVSCRELFKRMKAAGEDPCTLDAIL